MPCCQARAQPSSSRSNSSSPVVSAFHAVFKTGTGSPPPGCNDPATPKGSKSARAANSEGSGLHAAPPASPPAPAAATAPARAPRPGTEAGRARAGKVAPKRYLPLRVLPDPPFERWRAEERGGKNPFREGGSAGGRWRRARGPCQLQAARPGRGDAPEPRTRAAGRARAEGRGEGSAPPPRPRAAAAHLSHHLTPGQRSGDRVQPDPPAVCALCDDCSQHSLADIGTGCSDCFSFRYKHIYVTRKAGGRDDGRSGLWGAPIPASPAPRPLGPRASSSARLRP